VSFISKYLEHTSIYESPTSFWKYSAYATISAILRDSVWKKQGDKYLYPNIYTLLLADSAVQRKGNPIELCEKLVRAVGNTKIISGRSSIQSVFDVLSTAETDKKTGVLKKGGSAIFFAPELAASLVKDDAAIGILTNIYDYKEEYRDQLRGKGTTDVEKIVFSLFAGSNETLLKSVYNNDAIYGGLLGRTFVVKPDEFRKASSLISVVDTSQSFNDLIFLLKEIVKSVKGPIKISDDAAKEYEEWYVPFRESYRTKVDTTGIAGRMHTTIIKLAMILAANDMTVYLRKDHVEEAIGECMALMPNYKTFTISAGKGDLAASGGILIQALLDAVPTYKLSRKQILRIHWQDIDSEMLEKLSITLNEAGVIKIEQQGQEIVYGLSDKAKEDLGLR
jgi:hypothetical protein